MFDLKAYVTGKQERINAALDDLWHNQDRSPTPLVRAMRYSLQAGGKRLRPILCISASEVIGAASEADVMPAACAIELIHTYSLIHDDLPAMDDDDLRRGKPTCHKAFDEATAILAGDALLTAAFEILAGAGRHRSGGALKWLEAIYLIAKAAGYSGMVEGQMMDISSEGKMITIEALERLQRLKTGALIEASVRVGAVLGGGSPQEIAALGAYGRDIGLAFQIADDILNVEGTPEMLGKPVGSDEALQKATHPSITGLDEAKSHARQLVNHAAEALSIFGEKGEPLVSLARYVIERKT
jgi:geranylgeranyl diphosphate synthase type II